MAEGEMALLQCPAARGECVRKLLQGIQACTQSVTHITRSRAVSGEAIPMCERSHRTHSRHFWLTQHFFFVESSGTHEHKGSQTRGS
jgi:hypothetical protein